MEETSVTEMHAHSRLLPGRTRKGKREGESPDAWPRPQGASGGLSTTRKAGAPLSGSSRNSERVRKIFFGADAPGAVTIK